MATGTQSAATPPDKPMDDIHRAILRTCREELVRDMNAELVLRNMVDPNLFSEDDEDQIKKNTLTPRQKSEKLLDILPTKGSKAYEIFKETIRKVHLPLHYTIVQAAKRHGITSEEPTEPQSAEDILPEIRELTEYFKHKEKEELRRLLDQLKQMDGQAQKLVEANERGNTCSRCSKSESALDALRRTTEDNITQYEKEIRNLKTAKDELEPLEKDINKEESNTEGRGETCPRCSEWERVFDDFKTKDDEIKVYEELIRSLKRTKEELEDLKKDVNKEESNTDGGGKTCSRCSKWEKVFGVIRSKEEEIRCLQTAKN